MPRPVLWPPAKSQESLQQAATQGCQQAPGEGSGAAAPQLRRPPHSWAEAGCDSHTDSSRKCLLRPRMVTLPRPCTLGAPEEGQGPTPPGNPQRPSSLAWAEQCPALGPTREPLWTTRWAAPPSFCLKHIITFLHLFPLSDPEKLYRAAASLPRWRPGHVSVCWGPPGAGRLPATQQQGRQGGGRSEHSASPGQDRAPCRRAPSRGRPALYPQHLCPEPARRGVGGRGVGPDCSTPAASPASTPVGTWLSHSPASVPCDSPELSGATVGSPGTSLKPVPQGKKTPQTNCGPGPQCSVAPPATAQPRLLEAQEAHQPCRPQGSHAAPPWARPPGQTPGRPVSI